MAWVNLFETEAWTFSAASPLFGLDSGLNQNVVANNPASIEFYSDPTYGLEHHYITPSEASTGTALGYTIGDGFPPDSDPYQFAISPSGGVDGRLFRVRLLSPSLPTGLNGTIVVGTGDSSEFGGFAFPPDYTILWLDFQGPGDTEFIEFTGRAGAEWIAFTGSGAESSIYPYTAYFELQVWVDDPEPPSETLPFSQPSLVYELDRGWSFDGNYIPHFAELNWDFGENPVTYKQNQKIRIHGLTKGRALLTVAQNGMQTDYDYGDNYTEPQIVDLPRNSEYVMSDYEACTNYVDSANYGLALQMKFEGRNTDITRPEPSHVLQVLVIQSSPEGTGKRAN